MMFTKKNTPPKLQRTLDGIRKEKNNTYSIKEKKEISLSSFFSFLSKKRKLTSTFLLTILILGGVSFFFSKNIKGATYGWIQSSWIGGVTVNTATHTNNQENWTEFASKDTNIDTTSTPGEVKIVGVNNSWIQTSDADFNAGTNDGIVVSGGAVSSLRPPGASCTSYTQCTSYSCTGNLCGSDNGCGVAQDADGNRYGSIWVGTQCWLNRNLNVGTMLASASTLPTNNGTIEKWCYDNNSANCISEGGLYHWSEAMSWVTTEGAQGICPTGWHIPTDAEQNTLDQYLKDTLATCNASRSGAYDCISAGTKLKVNGISNMNIPLAGNRLTSGTFVVRGAYTYLWSSSVSGSDAWYRNLNSGSDGVGRGPYSQAYGFSVRCLKN
ncbi:MAG: hypothetical protein IPN70_04085 [Candidatus Moraniibacteriota bacterium]|nr:MAG: hypothetical protein IPN70_04085 [Candidatus Moranbacteria bacterium]